MFLIIGSSDQDLQATVDISKHNMIQGGIGLEWHFQLGARSPDGSQTTSAASTVVRCWRRTP